MFIKIKVAAIYGSYFNLKQITLLTLNYEAPPSVLVPSRGIEPLSRLPQSRVLSVERRGPHTYSASTLGMAKPNAE